MNSWPWQNLNPSPEEMRRAGGRCQIWAEKIQLAIGGNIMHIKPKIAGAEYIGPLRKKSGMVISAEFKEHYAIRQGGRIYDRITGPEGMSFQDYRQLFDYADDLQFEILSEEE